MFATNDDLVELFTTIGKVEQAEIQYEPSGRSRGTGVVRFDSAETAETAIAKFQGYQYGGRPLNLSFVKYLNQGGNDVMDTDPHGGLTQDQIITRRAEGPTMFGKELELGVEPQRERLSVFVCNTKPDARLAVTLPRRSTCAKPMARKISIPPGVIYPADVTVIYGYG
ncbi:hypothetical protein NM208_g11470 [Fusarium decemcellulare]|uniref:Uncharacterized protein n=1 Tax=Fusarium decemcellulare TaxID=57161 RepID=A0ACC1RSE5_9HYPO|nr:hypothetical protein NM208_g11470 [Fusarium decemcellulare]